VSDEVAFGKGSPRREKRAVARSSPLRRCANCQCGIEINSALCTFCGAILPHIAEVGREAQAIVCFSCGFQNHPDREICGGCDARLLQTCPGCGYENLTRVNDRCPQCDLGKGSFYETCVRLADARAAAKLRHQAVWATVILLSLTVVFMLVAVYQHLAGNTDGRNLAVATSSLAFLMWAVSLWVNREFVMKRSPEWTKPEEVHDNDQPEKRTPQSTLQN